MSPGIKDIRRSFLEKARRLMLEGKWPELMLAMDAVIGSSNAEDPSAQKELLEAYRLRGHSLMRMSKFEEAVADFQKALDFSKSLGDRTSEAMCLEGLGNVSWNMGDIPLGKEFFEGALEISEDIGDKGIEAKVRIGLANIQNSTGRLEEAVTGYEKAIEMLAKNGPSEPLARAFNNVGETLIKLGRVDDAIGFLGKASDMADKVGNLASRGFARTFLAHCYSYKGNLDFAKGLVDKAIDDLGKAHDQAGFVQALTVLSEIHGKAGRYDIALQEIHRAEMIAIKFGLDGAKSELVVEKARILAKKGNIPSAKDAYMEAIELMEKLGNDHWAEELEKEMTGIGHGK